MSEKKRNIGSNIREVRQERNLSQEALAKMCGFSNTTLSTYENGRKAPSLDTIAEIAKNLKVSIERLYYGDENIAFINTVPDEGRKIVNCIYVLWELDVIASPGAYMTFAHMAEHSGYFIEILKHPMPIARLISSLNEYRNNKDTYAEPDKYLEILLSSVATEINNEIHGEAELKKLTKKEK